MFRFILYTLVILVLISVLRSVIGVVTKAFAAFISAGGSQRPSAQQNAQVGGDLHRDPVCGTFVAESTPFQRRQAGSTFYYCSEACKEKHALVAR
jgi:hypothetical protein